MNDRSQILMCRPSHFAVEYVINPWMEGHVGRARREVAIQQWEVLHGIVRGLADVSEVDGGEHLPDMCFAANAGLVVGDRFVPTRVCRCRTIMTPGGGKEIKQELGLLLPSDVAHLDLRQTDGLGRTDLRVAIFPRSPNPRQRLNNLLVGGAAAQ